ncbi:hypothetical protein [Arenimonas sp. MALMAid1274]|uniref:hypothetical protein n=1 Tax=Arenimonas sp. MALMAid1274 TaxID=3411630 RepID=UPI003BA04191
MRLRLATALLLTLSLSACGSKDEAPAAGASPSGAESAQAAAAAADATPADAPPELPPMPAGDFRITSLHLGKAVDAEGQVREPVEAFGPKDKIHAAVTSVGSSEGLTLEARWTAADGTEVAKAGQSLSPTTPTVTTFSIAQPEPWPTGAYQVTISINGRAVETRGFTIQ